MRYNRFREDFLPVLRHVPDWFPGAGFKLKAKEGETVTRELNDLPFAEVERRLVSVPII